MTNEMKDTNPKDAIGVKKWRQYFVVPTQVIWEVGVGMLEGALKYGRHNYRASGVRASVYVDAAKGHIDSWTEGQDLDPDTKLSHITKAICSLVVLRDAEMNNFLVDDRPPRVDVEGHAARLQGIVDAMFEKHADKNPHHYTERENPAPYLDRGPSLESVSDTAHAFRLTTHGLEVGKTYQVVYNCNTGREVANGGVWTVSHRTEDGRVYGVKDHWPESRRNGTGTRLAQDVLWEERVGNASDADFASADIHANTKVHIFTLADRKHVCTVRLPGQSVSGVNDILNANPGWHLCSLTHLSDATDWRFKFAPQPTDDLPWQRGWENEPPHGHPSDYDYCELLMTSGHRTISRWGLPTNPHEGPGFLCGEERFELIPFSTIMSWRPA